MSSNFPVLQARHLPTQQSIGIESFRRNQYLLLFTSVRQFEHMRKSGREDFTQLRCAYFLFVQHFHGRFFAARKPKPQGH